MIIKLWRSRRPAKESELTNTAKTAVKVSVESEEGKALGAIEEAELKVVSEYVLLESPRVVIRIFEASDGRRLYHVIEPVWDSIVERAYNILLGRIRGDIQLMRSISEASSVEEAMEFIVLPQARRAVASLIPVKFLDKLSRRKRDEWKKRVEDYALAVAYYVARDLVGYGKIDPLIRDPHIEDITCDGVGVPVFVFHNEFEWLTTNIVFHSAEELEQVIMKLGLRAGQEPSIAQPIVEGVLRPEGYRVHIVLDVVSRRGHSFTIRKFRAEPFTVVELIRRKTLDPLVAAYLWMAVQYKQGVVIYGPTGSGKTTLLNAIAMLLPPEYKIVTAEDTPEIYLPFHENWVAMVTRISRDERVQNVTLQAQVESALRQRPDVIILGEIRSREAYAFFQALATGHGGLTTVHAESADVLIKRLSSPPMNVPRSLIAATRALVKIMRLEYRGMVVRKVVRVDEVWGYVPERDEILLREKLLWRRDDDVWFMKGRDSSLLKAVAELTLMSYDEVVEDLERRATVLRWAAAKNMDIVQLHTVVRQYMREPEKVYEKAVREVGPYVPVIL
jgi:flagellar protein FlaI